MRKWTSRVLWYNFKISAFSSKKTHKSHISQWEEVLTEDLHSIRSLLFTTTNCTPLEQLFLHTHRSTSRQSLPCLTEVPVVEWLLLLEMDTATRVQILDETVFHIALILLGKV